MMSVISGHVEADLSIFKEKVTEEISDILTKLFKIHKLIAKQEAEICNLKAENSKIKFPYKNCIDYK